MLILKKIISGVRVNKNIDMNTLKDSADIKKILPFFFGALRFRNFVASCGQET